MGLKKMIPEVSVIIPTYNDADKIGETIESVLNQTFSDFELIVVDDGSTDGTKAVVERFHDPRIRYIWQSNQERSAARNNGLAASRAPFIDFLDADDRYLPGKLAHQVPVLRDHPEVGMVLSGWVETDAQWHALLERRPWLTHPDPEPRDWFFIQLTRIGASLTRREWLTQIGGFDPDFSAVEDVDMWLRLIAAGCRTLWVKEIVMQRRRHALNTIADAKRMRSAQLAVIAKNFADPSFAAALNVSQEEAFARAHLEGACRQYAAGYVKEARADLDRAVEYDPSLTTIRASHVIDSIVSWANDPLIEDPIASTRMALANLPDSLSHLAASESKALGKTWAVKAFAAYQAADVPTVRRAVPKAIWHDPTWLQNRGLLSIWLRSLFRFASRKDIVENRN